MVAQAAVPALPTRWLAVRFGHMGDVVLTTGVLEYLGRTLNWRFEVLTKPVWSDIYRNHPCVDAVLEIDPGRRSVPELARDLRALAARRSGWGLLDLHVVPRSLLLSAFWQGPVRRYPKRSLERRLFLASRGRVGGGFLRRWTVPQRYALAVYPPADVPAAHLLAPKIFLDSDEQAAAGRLLHTLAGPQPAPVALHPFAAHPLKTWSATHWKRCAALLEEAGTPWVIVGRGQPLFPGDARDMTNRTSLRETCALLAGCRCLVTGDSGPMHLAAGVGTPVAALFGPTTREWGFYPVGGHDMIFETPLRCRPCSLHGRSHCPGAGDCLARIRPEEVVSRVLAAY